MAHLLTVEYLQDRPLQVYHQTVPVDIHSDVCGVSYVGCWTGTEGLDLEEGQDPAARRVWEYAGIVCMSHLTTANN